MKNYKMVLEYDGTRYNGWQKQGNTENTIQGRLENVLERLQGVPAEVHGAGRTDAGVHASGQVANARLDFSGTERELQNYLNEYLPKDIAVIALEQVPMKFHSRLNAVKKTYCYRIRTSPIRTVFERSYVWHLGRGLDADAMRQAADYLIGEHDFLPFCGMKKMKKSSVRRIEGMEIQEGAEELDIFITGNGFLYHMVRKITGMLAEIGAGEKQPEVIKEILETGNREWTGGLAPAQGLTLVQVFYPE